MAQSLQLGLHLSKTQRPLLGQTICGYFGKSSCARHTARNCFLRCLFVASLCCLGYIGGASGGGTTAISTRRIECKPLRYRDEVARDYQVYNSPKVHLSRRLSAVVLCTLRNTLSDHNNGGTTQSHTMGRRRTKLHRTLLTNEGSKQHLQATQRACC